MSKITLTIELDNNDAVDRAIVALSTFNSSQSNKPTLASNTPINLVEADPEQDVPVAPKEKPRKTKKAPEPETPTMDDFEIEEEEDEDEIAPNKTTVESVRAACQALANAGKAEIVKDCIKKMGVKSLGAIPEEKLGKFLTLLEKATK